MSIPTCDGWCEKANTPTHIGSNGYIYCKDCATRRRQTGYEKTRAMRAWELRLIAVGQPLPSYRVESKARTLS